MANGHGGIRAGQGRKSKADEQKVRKIGLDAIKKIYGSEEKFFQHIAKESKDSLPHLKLLAAYIYGQPTEKVNIDQTGELAIKSYNIVAANRKGS